MVRTSYSYANSAIDNNVEVLQDIHISNKNIAIYQRDITPIMNELDHIIEHPIECRASGTVKEVTSALENYFDKNFPEYASIASDASELLKVFETITEASSFRILLAKVSTNMCRKFHTDINKIRLLCTYVGPGTIWLPDEAIDFKALQRRSKEQDIIKDHEQVQQASTGDVVLLKGALYPDANPILHRSPTIEESGEKRLLLRIDINESFF